MSLKEYFMFMKNTKESLTTCYFYIFHELKLFTDTRNTIVTNNFLNVMNNFIKEKDFQRFKKQFNMQIATKFFLWHSKLRLLKSVQRKSSRTAIVSRVSINTREIIF